MRSVGIDLGGTKLFFGVVDDAGNLEDEQRIPTPDSWEEMKSSIVELVSQYQERHDDIAAVGFGAAGMIALDGYAYYSPNVPAFDDGVPIRTDLTRELSVPVFIDNDANCAGYGEAQYGNARSSQEIIVVTLGTGIGGAIISKGAVYRGAHGFAAELGHFTMDLDGPLCACGKYGCFESLASGHALGRIGRQYAARGDADNLIAQAGGNIDDIEGLHVGAVASRGLADGVAIMDDYANNVATGLISLANIFDPETFIIGGGVVELGDTLFAPLTRHFLAGIEGGTSRPMPTIVPAALGERAGVIGAGALALAHLK